MILIVNVPDMTTIVDIAKKLNISKSTVSRALTNSAGVSAKTRDLVLKTAKDMRYSANAYARSLVSKRSHMICFMIPDITDTFYQMMANAAETVLAKAGYSVFYKNVRRDPEEAMRFLQLAIEYNMDGVFITLDDWTDDICSMIGAMTIPVISLRRRTPECLRGKVPYVDSDYDDGIDNAVTYLMSLGHKEIGYIGFETLVGLERLVVFEESCERHGLRKNIIRNRSFQDAGVRIDVGYNSAKKLINDNPRITALFAGDDQLALGALRYLGEKGIAVPDEMSVLGCDDRSISSLYCVQLSTLRQERAESGRLAGQLMLRMIEEPGYCEDIKVPMTIKERKTVGRARI